MSALLSGLIGAVIATGVAALAERGRKKAIKGSDNWKSLYAGWYLHSIVIGCVAAAAFFAFILLNGGSTREDAETQNLYAVGILAAFSLMALYVAWLSYGRTVSWKRSEIRTKNIFGQERFYYFADIHQIKEIAFLGEHVIKFTDGSRLRFFSTMHGTPEFLWHLPTSKFKT